MKIPIILSLLLALASGLASVESAVAQSLFHSVITPDRATSRIFLALAGQRRGQVQLGCYGSQSQASVAISSADGLKIRVLSLARLARRSVRFQKIFRAQQKTCIRPSPQPMSSEYAALFPMSDGFPGSGAAHNVVSSANPAVCLGVECPVAEPAVAPQGSAPRFDGLNDKLVVVDSLRLPSGQGLTIGGFVEITSETVGVIISSSASRSGGQLWSLSIDIGPDAAQSYHFKLRTGNRIHSVSAPVSASDSAWRLVNGVYDPVSERMIIYENGIEIASRRKSGLLPGGSSLTVIGAQRTVGGNDFKGRIGSIGIAASPFSPEILMSQTAAFAAGAEYPTPVATPTAQPSLTPTPTNTPVAGGSNSSQVTLELSRTSGVAPLAIFADAERLSPHLAQGDFLNAHIAFDFDTTNVDPTGEGRHEYGFLAGHVYTRPGSYQVSMSVVDTGGHAMVAAPVTVTVQDPEVVFMPPLGETYCFSTSASDFAGCPTTDPARRIVTTSFQSALNYGGINRRLLFRRGDTWYSNSAEVVISGPQHIGAFPEPLSLTASARPRIVSNAGDWSSILRMNASSDVRVTDLQFVGNFTGLGSDPRVGGISADASTRGLIYNTILEQLNHIGIYTGYGTEQLTIAKNTIRNSGNYGIYGGANRLAILRNQINNLKFTQHGIRIQGGPFSGGANSSRSVVSGNRITDLESFTAITMRGMNDRMVLSDNLVEAFIGFAPQNNLEEEYVSNVLFERNTSRPLGGASVLGAAVGCVARFVVIRNNLWLNAGLGVGMGDHPIVGGCEDADIYNNTFINQTNFPQDEHHLLYTGSQVRRISLFNNIYYSTSSTNWGSALTFNGPVGELMSHSNIYYAPNQGPNWFQFFLQGGTWYSLSGIQALGFETGSVNGSPQFESLDPLSESFLKPMVGSPAVDSGLPVVNRLDLARRDRPRDGDGNGSLILDRGAVER